jgi:AcrR family transcriptional regulator
MAQNDKRSRGRPKTVARDDAIASAMLSYWERGLHALSVNALCKEAGISKPALYREFGGEDGLMTAALALYRAQVVAPLLDAVASARPFRQVLDRIVVGMSEPRGRPVGCLFTKMRLSAGRLGPEATAAVRALERERLGAFEAWYARALERGEANAALQPEFAARYIDNQFSSLLVQMGADADPTEAQAEARLAMSVLYGPLDPSG